MSRIVSSRDNDATTANSSVNGMAAPPVPNPPSGTIENALVVNQTLDTVNPFPHHPVQ
jgi:hypothetical protein